LNQLMRRLKLRDLQVLSAVVQWGSMAKAAARLAMSQPAVSQSVAALEQLLGVRLLDRTSRGVEPTAYAIALLKRSRVVFDELEQAAAEVAFLANPTVGEVRVAAGDTLAAGLLPRAIDRLSSEHPAVVVHVLQTNADGQEFRELRERRIDFALARTTTKLAHDDLDVELLFDDPHRVVAAANSPWARRRKLELSDLVHERWVFASNHVVRELIAEAFAARGLEMPQERVSANSILLRNDLLATGRFLTVLPDSVLQCHAKQWSLKALAVDLDVKPRSVAMVSLKGRAISPVAQVFAKHVRAAARDFGLVHA